MYNDCMGLGSIIIAYKLGKRKQTRAAELQELRDERLLRKQMKDRCFRCHRPYIEHTRENRYRCP